MSMTRKMWALVDTEIPNRDAQLYAALDGRLFSTRPIPAHPWLKAVRVVIEIQEWRAVAATPSKAKRAVTPSASEAP